MRKALLIVAALALTLGAFRAHAADQDAAMAESAVRDYEDRVEKVANEIDQVRRELETLTREMVEGETGRTLIFLKGKASDWSDRGVAIMLDGKLVFSRLLSPAELDAVSRGLPLELIELRLVAGKHKVALSAMGEANARNVEMAVKRASLNSWVAEAEGGTVQWTAE